MKIQENLPQFKNKRVLIIATGKQIGSIYFAHNGEIDKIDSIKEETPTYSDREGFFSKSGKGEKYGTGSVYEDKEGAIRKRFSKKLVDAVEENLKTNPVDGIILVGPRHTMNKYVETFPAPIQAMTTLKIAANYAEHHPFEILKKIKERTNRSSLIVKPIKREALKILQRFRGSGEK